MSILTFQNKEELIEAVAKSAIDTLRGAIEKNGSASWVLAGGSTPFAAYEIIAQKYLHDIDWSKVTLLIGDERIAPLDSADSNWHAAERALLSHLPAATMLRPRSDQPAEIAAEEYENRVKNIARYDLVWLGMGEDGHTLSLFPEHPDFAPTNRLVIPVHHSPKPPADRISFTLTALERADHTVIMATGKAKAEAFRQAQEPSSQLPIAQAARLTQAQWYIDHTVADL